MESGRLKSVAGEIDSILNAANFQTLVHGDAKLANFCFAADDVAAVDFQYVGGGCGIKDVAYFASSCFRDVECERREASLLDCYFGHLKQAIEERFGQSIDAGAVEKEWRQLYPIAWTDFYRFLAGWSPGHWKMHGYSERLAAEVIANL
jgi:thiamine kinase-like enzyme